MNQQDPRQTSAGKPAQDRSISESDAPRPTEVREYMKHLGGGTGVDIGPGAAGEMSHTEDKDALDRAMRENEEDTISETGVGGGVDRNVVYPDSGDLPRVEPPGNVGDV